MQYTTFKAAAQSSFWADRSDLPAIQEAVKKHGLRFDNNPAAWMEHPRVLVIVEADTMEAFNAGMAAIDAIRLAPVIVEPENHSVWDFWRWVFGLEKKTS